MELAKMETVEQMLSKEYKIDDDVHASLSRLAEAVEKRHEEVNTKIDMVSAKMEQEMAGVNSKIDLLIAMMTRDGGSVAAPPLGTTPNVRRDTQVNPMANHKEASAAAVATGQAVTGQAVEGQTNPMAKAAAQAHRWVDGSGMMEDGSSADVLGEDGSHSKFFV
jgi:hypothetical protein